MNPPYQSPERRSYDVVIVGGAMLGSAIAWFLSDNPEFDGSVLVVEKDPGYEFTSTARTNSCIRQQFTQELNIRISQFGVAFLKDFRANVKDPQAPDITLQSFGYLYLAGSKTAAETLRETQTLQADCGAGTQHMTRADIAQQFPFYNLQDIVAGNLNPVDEGYFDGNTMFDWWKRLARRNGVEYLTNEVTAMTCNPAATRVESVTLSTGEIISCGVVVNASGPRASLTAQMAGINIPVEPRKRYSFIFSAQSPLDQTLPLTIDPSGVHFRADGAYYLAGCAPDIDQAVAHDDFDEDHDIWESKVWPAIANRIPQFDALRLVNSWAGHYAYNTLDQNAIVGPHTRVSNFLFANGFSGHGFQQSPAVGRAISELITYGEYRNLDLGALGFARIEQGKPFIEKAII